MISVLPKHFENTLVSIDNVSDKRVTTQNTGTNVPEDFSVYTLKTYCKGCIYINISYKTVK